MRGATSQGATPEGHSSLVVWRSDPPFVLSLLFLCVLSSLLALSLSLAELSAFVPPLMASALRSPPLPRPPLLLPLLLFSLREAQPQRSRSLWLPLPNGSELSSVLCSLTVSRYGFFQLRRSAPLLLLCFQGERQWRAVLLPLRLNTRVVLYCRDAGSR